MLTKELKVGDIVTIFSDIEQKRRYFDLFQILNINENKVKVKSIIYNKDLEVERKDIIFMTSVTAGVFLSFLKLPKEIKIDIAPYFKSKKLKLKTMNHEE